MVTSRDIQIQTRCQRVMNISNMNTSQGRGEHWVTFYCPKRGPFEVFDSLGHMPEDYEVGFEILNNIYSG